MTRRDDYGRVGDSHQLLTQLCRILTETFDEDELRGLCFDLGVEYDDLPGQTRMRKARELVKYLERRGRLLKLIQIGQQLRPNVSWEEILGALEEASSESQQDLLRLQIPHNLPPRSIFVGREQYKARVHRALQSPPNLVSIDGIGGIGKTALALEAAHECLQASQGECPIDDIATFAGLVWTSATRDELTLGVLLGKVARTLGYLGIIEKSIMEKREAVCELFKAKPYLLVVDNLETVADEQIKEFLFQLPEPSKALVTSRERLARGQIITLQRLEQSEGLALIRSEGERLDLKAVEKAPDQALLPLHQATGGMPLAIKWALGQVKQRGQPLRRVLADLAEAGADIFEHIFDRSWNLLSPDALRVLMVIPLFAAPASWESLEAVSDVSGSGFDKAMGQLVEMSLVDATDDLLDRRYSVHMLTHSFVRQQQVSEPQFIQQALERMLAYYRELVTPSAEMRIDDSYWCGLVNYTAAPTLETEWPNVKHLINWALSQDRGTDALALFLPLVHILNAWGLWSDRLELSYKMCEVAHRLNDPVEAWLWIDAIGYILNEHRQTRKVEQALEKGRAVAHRFNLADALILADTFESWLYYHSQARDVDLTQQKIESFLQVIDLDSVLDRGKVQQIVLARSIAALSILYLAQGDFLTFKEMKEKELKLRRLIGENPTPVLIRLASLNVTLKDIPSAEKYLAQALVNPRLKDLASLRSVQASIAKRKGNLQEARLFYIQAIEWYQRLGKVEKVKKQQSKLAKLEKLIKLDKTKDS